MKIDWRVLRNYFISILFIGSCVFCYFKDKGVFTLKNATLVWTIILIGWGINFILDNHKKMDNTTESTLSVLKEIESTLKDNKDKIDNPNTMYNEIKDFYNTVLNTRKTFKDEIWAIVGLIGTLLGSTTFIKFLGL